MFPRRAWFSKSMRITCGLLLAAAALLPAASAHAADDQWIAQVWKEYTAYNKKTVDAYESYLKQTERAYQQFYDDSHRKYEEMMAHVHADQKEWHEKLEADLKELQERYGDDKNVKSKLRQYSNDINPNFLNSPMWKYEVGGNPNYLNSTMWKLNKALNENYLESLMWTYSKTINPNYLNSSMWKYSKTVNENYLNSPMQKLKKGSSEHHLGSPIQKYSKGKLTKTQAKKLYAELKKEQTANVSKGVAASKKAIAELAASTEKEIGALHTQTVQLLEKQREESLQAISDLRKEICGEGLQWEPLFLAPEPKENTAA